MRSYFSVAAAFCLIVSFFMIAAPVDAPAWGQAVTPDSKEKATLRFASFNISFNRKTEGQLKKSLVVGQGVKLLSHCGDHSTN